MDTPHVTDVATAELEDWGPLAEATGPEMTTRGVDLWVEGPLSGGIWECTPGPSYWTQDEHEVIHLVAGRMTVTPDGGEPTELPRLRGEILERDRAPSPFRHVDPRRQVACDGIGECNLFPPCHVSQQQRGEHLAARLLFLLLGSAFLA